MHRRARRAALGAVMALALGLAPLAAPAQELPEHLVRAGFTPLHAAVWRNDVAASRSARSIAAVSSACWRE